MGLPNAHDVKEGDYWAGLEPYSPIPAVHPPNNPDAWILGFDPNSSRVLYVSDDHHGKAFSAANSKLEDARLLKAPDHFHRLSQPPYSSLTSDAQTRRPTNLKTTPLPAFRANPLTEARRTFPNADGAVTRRTTLVINNFDYRQPSAHFTRKLTLHHTSEDTLATLTGSTRVTYQLLPSGSEVLIERLSPGGETIQTALQDQIRPQEPSISNTLNLLIEAGWTSLSVSQISLLS